MPLSIQRLLTLVIRGKVLYPKMLLEHGCGCAHMYMCNTVIRIHQTGQYNQHPPPPPEISCPTQSETANLKPHIKENLRDTVYGRPSASQLQPHMITKPV